MARVTPAIPAIGLPCASAALPVKFTRRGTGADDCVVALCWAAARKQDTEIARIMESEYLPDFIRSSFSVSGQSLPVLFLERERRAISICQPFSAMSGFSSPICNGGKHGR